MDQVSRPVLAATAAGGALTLTRGVNAQGLKSAPQTPGAGRGGTDPGPRNLARDRQNPDLLTPSSTDHGRSKSTLLVFR
jgi:oxalate decarboxylase